MKNECISCENFDLSANVCLIDGSKGYANKKCLHINCDRYAIGHWTTNEDEHILPTPTIDGSSKNGES